MKNISICVTGHRPSKLLGGYDLTDIHNLKIKDEMRIRLETILLSEKVECLTCYSGMALGIDTLFAEVVLELRELYNSKIRLVAAIPTTIQENRWTSDSQEYYRTLLDLADEVVNVSGNDDYKAYYMIQRNNYMVDNSDLVLAYWDGIDKGGTAQAFSRAKSKNKQVIVSNTGIVSQ